MPSRILCFLSAVVLLSQASVVSADYSPFTSPDSDDVLSLRKLFAPEILSKPVEQTIPVSHRVASMDPYDEGRSASEGGHHHPGGWVSARADSHAPLGVMGDHTHAKGEWMLSYRYMHMHMDGMRSGDSSVSASDVIGAGFMVTPTDMNMDMSMFGIMHAPTDDVTLMLMINYVHKSMNHVTGMSTKFKTVTEGMGDTKLSALYSIHKSDHHRVHLTIGISAPTGQIDRKDMTPMGNVRLPYPMQLGSGTWDILPGVTYFGQSEDWSWGAQANGVIRIGRSRYDYSLGDRFEITGWLAYKWNKNASVSVRIKSSIWGNIDGSDAGLATIVPTARNDMRGGHNIEMFVGANVYFTSGPLKGHRFAVEVGTPLYEKLQGYQLETDLILILGWQYAW